MPHFVIDCSDHIVKIKSPDDIMRKVFAAAESTDLFDKEDIKVRINPFEYYTIGTTKDDFIHVFANIMEGRNTSQKKGLSRKNLKYLN